MFSAPVYEVLYGYMGRFPGVAGIIPPHAIFFEMMWAFSGFTFLMHFVAYASITLFPQRTIIPLHTRNDSESG